jgi:formate dehydrogenase accessory protein FdhE
MPAGAGAHSARTGKPGQERLVHELEIMAKDALLNQVISALIGSDKAPFIWAALSLYWAQMASTNPRQSASAEYGEHRQYCPVCGSIPVASVVHMGTPSADCAICTATCAKASGMWCV